MNEKNRKKGGTICALTMAAAVIRGVEPSAELYRFLALQAGHYTFPKIFAREMEPLEGESGPTVMIGLAYDMVANYLTADDFTAIVSTVAQNADELDDEIQSRFGGLRERDWDPDWRGI